LKRIYVSNNGLKKCVEYFRNTTISSPEQLGMFFFFKSIGFSENEYKAFPKVSGISDEQRQDYLKKLYNLSAVFDKDAESGEKRCCLFPFSITSEIGSKQQFNPGTVFKGLLSRMRDTVDNTLVDDTKFLRKDDTNPDFFKFPRDYIQILQNNFLNNQRISLVYFSAWYFRLRGVECNDSWLENPNVDLYKAFTRVCTKTLVEELKLTDSELNELFYHDEDEIIPYSSNKISGTDLRGHLQFAKDSIPEIKELPRGGIDYMSDTKDIEIQKTEELSQPTGNNITVDSLKSLLNASKQVILYGAPGTSKSHITNKIKDDFEDSAMIQFHASLTYEQFIGGISVDSDGKFVSKPGIFLDFCERARREEENGKKYLFIIDEINRGNVSKIFGETILTLDREYTADLVSPIIWEGNSVKKFSIPSNVYIIATMNSADRSIAQIDYAIRRRFAFVKFYPNYELVESISDCTELSDIKPNVLFKSINKALLNVLKDENMLLGHAYFIPKWAIQDDKKIHWTPEVLKVLINYYVLPIIEEYTYGNSRYLANILGSTIPTRIDDNDLFISEIKKQFRVD
jgi:5-methylcytosine-specific restriction enzyme B